MDCFFGTVCRPGIDVITISSLVGQLNVTTVYNVDRSMPIYIFIAAFLILLCLIGGKKGVKSSIALILALYVLYICFSR